MVNINPQGIDLVTGQKRRLSNTDTLTDADGNALALQGLTGIQGIQGGQGSTGIQPAITGKVVQQVSASTSALISTTASIPLDDTIPQITEGAQILQVSITPTSTSNTLLIEFTTSYSNSGGSGVVIALFRDSIASAISAAGAFNSTSVQMVPGVLRHSLTAPSTSSQTYRIRMGIVAFTLYVNGISAARVFGGVASTILTVTEISP